MIDALRRSGWAWAILLAIATVIAYWPALSGEMVWDDEVHIAKPDLVGWAGLWRIWTDPASTQQYYPVAHTAFWIQRAVWDLWLPGYHAVNVLLHIANALLIWRILTLLQVRGAIIAAGLFALHPVHVESVAWMAELKNTLSTCFCLTAFLSLMRFDPASFGRDDSSHVDRRMPWLWLSLALFVLGMLSKSSVATFPAAVLVIIWWKQGRLEWRRHVVPLLPFFVIGISLALLTVHFERTIWGSRPENFGGDHFQWSWIERAIIAGRASWFYLGKLAWPTHLAFFYERWHIDSHQAWQFLPVLGVIAVVPTLWLLRHRLGRGPLAAILLYGGILFPALGFVNLFWQVYTFVCDHMQYMASIAPLALFGAVLGRWLSIGPAQSRIVAATVTALVLTSLGVLTWRQSHVYRDSVTLWTDTVKKSPNSWASHENLGAALHKAGRIDEALSSYRKALQLNDEAVEVRIDLGRALAERGELGEAREHLNEAVRLGPTWASAHVSLGDVLIKLQRPAEAIPHLETGLRLNPSLDGSWNNLGVAWATQGKLAEAEQSFSEAVRRNPRNSEAHLNLARALIARRAFDQAIPVLDKAIELRPELASNLLQVATTLANQGERAIALAICDCVVRRQPGHATAREVRRLIEAGQANQN